MITEFGKDGESVVLTPANDFYLDPENGKDEVRLCVCAQSERSCAGRGCTAGWTDEYKKEHPENIKEEFKK